MSSASFPFFLILFRPSSLFCSFSSSLSHPVPFLFVRSVSSSLSFPFLHLLFRPPFLFSSFSFVLLAFFHRSFYLSFFFLRRTHSPFSFSSFSCFSSVLSSLSFFFFHLSRLRSPFPSSSYSFVLDRLRSPFSLVLCRVHFLMPHLHLSFLVWLSSFIYLYSFFFNSHFLSRSPLVFGDFLLASLLLFFLLLITFLQGSSRRGCSASENRPWASSIGRPQLDLPKL